MKIFKLSLALAAFVAVAGIAYVAQRTENSGANMASAAQAFVNTLTADQKKQAVYDYDNEERFNWNFIPLQDKAA